MIWLSGRDIARLRAFGDAVDHDRGCVAVADVEFMQSPPTALHPPAMPRPLLVSSATVP